MSLFTRSRFYVIACIVLNALPFGLSAPPDKPGLEWESKKVERRVAFSSPGTEGVFKFKNTSDKPVHILGVTSSCGCTVGKLEKDVYAAGESGEVSARFQVGNKRGRQVSILTVRTDGDPAPVKLELVVEIYEHMTLGSRFLVWEQGAAAAKEVLIRFEDAGKVAAIEVAASQPGFSAQVKATEDPNVWKLTITRDTQEPLRSTCAIKAKTEKSGVLASKVFMLAR
ncbi:MAG: DUF1573 domain-containing protein [Opitutaceae bacterium]|jgi:hypothetical protein